MTLRHCSGSSPAGPPGLRDRLRPSLRPRPASRPRPPIAHDPRPTNLVPRQHPQPAPGPASLSSFRSPLAQAHFRIGKDFAESCPRQASLIPAGRSPASAARATTTLETLAKRIPQWRNSRHSRPTFPLSGHGPEGSSTTVGNADRAVQYGFRRFPALICASGDPLHMQEPDARLGSRRQVVLRHQPARPVAEPSQMSEELLGMELRQRLGGRGTPPGTRIAAPRPGGRPKAVPPKVCAQELVLFAPHSLLAHRFDIFGLLKVRVARRPCMQFAVPSSPRFGEGGGQVHRHGLRKRMLSLHSSSANEAKNRHPCGRRLIRLRRLSSEQDQPGLTLGTLTPHPRRGVSGGCEAQLQSHERRQNGRQLEGGCPLPLTPPQPIAPTRPHRVEVDPPTTDRLG